MADRLVLHIGSMKSGTSFLQNVLGENKQRLADQGLLFAGPRWKAQVEAVRELMGAGGPSQPALAEDGPWRRLAAEVNQWPHTAVISMEFLGPRTPRKITQILDSFPDTRIEAVLSARDLARNIPAMWLESVQNGSTTSWADYLDAVRTEDRRSVAGRNFWRQQAIPAIAKRWSGMLPDGSFTLLTVPRPGAPRELLWERFASILGIDPTGCELDVRANPSIGLATAQLLLRLNRRMVREDGSLPMHYDKYVKHLLVKRGLVSRYGDEPRLGLDAEWVLKRGRSQVKKLKAQRVHVVGDLEELIPAPVAGRHADEVTVEEQLEAAVDGLAHLVGTWSRHDRRRRRRARAANEGP